ncbi:GTPase, G3E family [Saccharopolyspora kobensis]|uniref:GTPase, G3E family n=1 Tax=Saccharopolyspora kobensis TaxID=146035 RepID=A0A1H6D4I1_9PSEU|nr:GTP-binding protein [Saccharopolyspora kobensis]SEG80171.1 GTPase, G3E family [Saccharopolyspora kobensis]SFD10951.1 GTPase, G3E family [Saccharopolyspora kobensis]
METESSANRRMPLLLVAGIRAEQVASTAEAVRRDDPAGTALVHHDLREVAQGVVRRLIRHGDAERVEVLELAHGCVSCTLRLDLLPLLRELTAAPDVTRIVVQLDPALEPDTICWALQHVEVDGRPLVADVRVEAVLTAVDAATWLADATGQDELVERGIGGSPDDERTVAQVAVGQVEFADAVVLLGEAEDRWTQVRTEAVIARLTPTAPQIQLKSDVRFRLKLPPDVAGLDVSALLARVPGNARRGEVDGPHGRLLRGQPSLDTDAGVSTVLFEERRPFHPERLHEAIDVLLDGVVRTRGRVWVASQPDVALWIESAGGGLGIAHGGPWLASLTAEQWAEISPERQVRASLSWDDYYGDRAQELVVIAHEANPQDIVSALRHALLTDDELAAGEQVWATYADPFGEWHTDPCGDDPAERSADAASERGNRS